MLNFVDVSDDESVNKAKAEVEKKLGKNQGLNCLLNNAGVSKGTQLNNINEQDMLDTYKHNVVGPWRVTKVCRCSSVLIIRTFYSGIFTFGGKSSDWRTKCSSSKYH